MKLFRVLVLVVALVAGGIAAYLALNLGPGGTPAPTVVELAPQIQSQDVLVAAADIGQGAEADGRRTSAGSAGRTTR